MRRFLYENGLSLTFGALFLATLVAQAFVGHSDFNNTQVDHSDPTMSLGRYLLSSAFWVDVMENWQSEYLQFTLFVLLTVWLVQKGSPESKELGKEGLGPDVGGGLRRRLYSHSLLIVMGMIWVGSWLAQAVTGRVEFNAEQFDHREAALSLWQYVGTSDFWNRTLQNWQSEFLAVGSFAVLTIYLRERGSPESKPVGAPHDATGVEG